MKGTKVAPSGQRKKASRMIMRECQACGDRFSENRRQSLLTFIGEEVRPGELAYCFECANEIYRDRITIGRAQLDSSGRGSPLEPNDDDASPGQEGAIHKMEG